MHPHCDRREGGIPQCHLEDSSDGGVAMNFYENGQWAVTEYGLQAIEPGSNHLDIIAEHLPATFPAPEGPVYAWPCHVAKEEWVDMADFLAAFREAFLIHRKAIGVLDEDILRNTLQRVSRCSSQQG